MWSQTPSSLTLTPEIQGSSAQVLFPSGEVAQEMSGKGGAGQLWCCCS